MQNPFNVVHHWHCGATVHDVLLVAANALQFAAHTEVVEVVLERQYPPRELHHEHDAAMLHVDDVVRFEQLLMHEDDGVEVVVVAVQYPRVLHHEQLVVERQKVALVMVLHDEY